VGRRVRGGELHRACDGRGVRRKLVKERAESVSEARVGSDEGGEVGGVKRANQER